MATVNAPESAVSDRAAVVPGPEDRATPPAGSGPQLATRAEGNRLIATVCAVGGGMLHVVQVAIDAARGRYDY
jgi:hypothetical protein